MKRLQWLCVCALISGLAVGCGDDDAGGTDAGGGGEDTGMPPAPVCPAAAPDTEGLMGECCYRSTNDPAAPTFRISGLSISSPGSLASPIVRAALRDALDEERFNWLISVTGAAADGDIMVSTGYGNRNTDATYSFTMDSAPMPGDADRWNPITLNGTLAGETMTAPPIVGSFTVPIFEEDGTTLAIELPLQAFEVQMATMSADRNCVGLRTGPAYDNTQGSIRTYMTVEDAMARRLVVGPIDNDLCSFTANITGDGNDCSNVDQSMWTVKPDALCTDGTCADGCDPDTTCNAWTIAGGFAAHSVTIN